MITRTNHPAGATIVIPGTGRHIVHDERGYAVGTELRPHVPDAEPLPADAGAALSS